jgi:hypothetical protein
MQLPDLESKDLAHWMLDQITDHFTEDPLNRRCKGAGGFFYSPKSLKKPHKDNIGCTIGMFLDPLVSEKLDKELRSLKGDCSIQSVKERGQELESFKDIPERLWEVDIKILTAFQSLHDTRLYWDGSNEISNQGVKFVSKIRKLIEQCYN